MVRTKCNVPRNSRFADPLNTARERIDDAAVARYFSLHKRFRCGENDRVVLVASIDVSQRGQELLKKLIAGAAGLAQCSFAPNIRLRRNDFLRRELTARR